MNQTDTLRVVQPVLRLGDPHSNTDSTNALNLRFAVYDALVRREGPGEFGPALATGWTCEPDARTWTFDVREGVALSDGTPLTAADVVASVRRATSPDAPGEMATQGVMASYFHQATVDTIGRDRVRIVMGRPMADLLDLLVDMAITKDGDISIGTGPYWIVEASDERVVMEAVADHWRGDPLAGRVEWLAEGDAERRVEMLLEGAADLAANLEPEGRAAIEASEQASVVETVSSLAVAFLCNAAQGPCTDARVRRALNYGLDVDRIVTEVMGRTAEPLNGIFTPLHFGHDPDVTPYPYDPQRARKLLAEAGHASGLVLTIDVPTRLPDEALALGEQLVEQYRAIGVEVTIREFDDRPAYAQMVRDKRIDDACCFDSSPISTYRVLREKMHSRVQGPWWQGYANPEVDALIDRAAETVDDAERRGIYQQAYRIIRDDAPWIFLYSPAIAYGVGPKLGGWRPAINGMARFI